MDVLHSDRSKLMMRVQYFNIRQKLPFMNLQRMRNDWIITKEMFIEGILSFPFHFHHLFRLHSSVHIPSTFYPRSSYSAFIILFQFT